MEDIRCRPFSLHDVLSSILVISFYLDIPVEINNLSCHRNSIHLLQKRVKCLIHEWHHLKWRIKEKWKTKSMLKAIMFKFNVQIKIANKQTILLKDFIHTTTPDVSPGGGGGVLKKFLGVGCAAGTLEPLAYSCVNSNLPISFLIYIFLSGNSRFPRSGLKSSTNSSISWKMIPYSRPKLWFMYPIPE